MCVDHAPHRRVFLTDADEGFLVPKSSSFLLDDDPRCLLDEERALLVYEG